jgi:elongation factor 1 alpha-like protein
MQIGTRKVREALNSSISISDAQIQEALWHYYYDIGKSVTYLKSGNLIIDWEEIRD